MYLYIMYLLEFKTGEAVETATIKSRKHKLIVFMVVSRNNFYQFGFSIYMFSKTI